MTTVLYSIIGIVGTGPTFHPYEMREFRQPQINEVFDLDGRYWMFNGSHMSPGKGQCTDVTDLVYGHYDAEHLEWQQTADCVSARGQ